MSKKTDEIMDDRRVLQLMVITLATVFIFVATGVFIYKHRDTSDTYKQGQIDALNGKIKYQKEVQPDSTVIWVEIKSNIK